MFCKENPTFMAGEALAKARRVKINTSSTTTPVEVVYADAGEGSIGVTVRDVASGDDVAIRLWGDGGTYEVEAAGAITVGATVYGADDGKISTTSSGSSNGVVKAAVSGSGSIAELVPAPYLSTTAATVSIADSGGFTSTATVEAALAEIYQHLVTAQGFIPIALTSVWESDATNASALTGATTPVLDMANGDTDSGMVLTWVASNSDAIIFQTPLPPDIDTTADVVVHFRAKSGGSTDTPTFAADSYFNEGDTKVEDTSSALGAAVAENTITIAAADVPSGAQTLTCELTPGAHTTDTIVLSAIWVEYTKSILTS